MKTAAYVTRTQTTKRTEDFRELMNDLLDESERALEEDDIAWCAVVHRLLMPVVEREVAPGGTSLEAAPEAD